MTKKITKAGHVFIRDLNRAMELVATTLTAPSASMHRQQCGYGCDRWLFVANSFSPACTTAADDELRSEADACGWRYAVKISGHLFFTCPGCCALKAA